MLALHLLGCRPNPDPDAEAVTQPSCSLRQLLLRMLGLTSRCCRDR